MYKQCVNRSLFLCYLFSIRLFNVMILILMEVYVQYLYLIFPIHVYDDAL